MLTAEPVDLRLARKNSLQNSFEEFLEAMRTDGSLKDGTHYLLLRFKISSSHGAPSEDF